jgi:hypothetical protein
MDDSSDPDYVFSFDEESSSSSSDSDMINIPRIAYHSTFGSFDDMFPFSSTHFAQPKAHMHSIFEIIRRELRQMDMGYMASKFWVRREQEVNDQPDLTQIKETIVLGIAENGYQ